MSMDLQELPVVRIYVRGGVVQDVECPDGIHYEVIDYDNGADEPCEDCGGACGKNAQYHEHGFWTCGCIDHDEKPDDEAGPPLVTGREAIFRGTLADADYDTSPPMRRTIKVVAACTNAGGEPDFTFVKVECSEVEHNLGEHYDAARDAFVENGYEGPFVFFDEVECPDWLMERFVWESATCVSAQEPENSISDNDVTEPDDNDGSNRMDPLDLD